MKRLWIFLVVVVILAGCGKKVVQPVPEEPEDVPVIQKELVPVILDADVPVRDPFAAGGGRGESGPAGVVPEDGRNPFVVAQAGTQWNAEAGKVSTAGRDPFEEGSGDVEPPPVVPQEPEEPTGPTDPVQVPTGEVLVEVKTSDRCWLDVFVDDVRVLRTNVRAGETLSWQGENEIRLEQVGREMAVRVTVNGQDLGRLGDLVGRLEKGPVNEAGVRISLDKRYSGGVLVGLRFSVLN